MALATAVPGHWSTSKQIIVFFFRNWLALWALHLGNSIVSGVGFLVGLFQYKATFAVFSDASATTAAKYGVMEGSVILGFAASAVVSAYVVPVMFGSALGVIRSASPGGSASFSFLLVLRRSWELYKCSWLTFVRIGLPLILALMLITASQTMLVSSPDVTESVSLAIIILAYVLAAIALMLAAIWGLQLILAPCYCMDGYTAREALDQSKGMMKGHIGWMYRINLHVYGMVVLPVLLLVIILIYPIQLSALWVLLLGLLAVWPAQYLAVPFVYQLLTSSIEDAQLLSELSVADEV